jgi:hypothetical protein
VNLDEIIDKDPTTNWFYWECSYLWCSFNRIKSGLIDRSAIITVLVDEANTYEWYLSYYYSSDQASSSLKLHIPELNCTLCWFDNLKNKEQQNQFLTQEFVL